MKKTLTLLLSIVVLLNSCVKDDLNNILSRLDNLEAWQKSVNTDITTLKTLVETLDGKDFVTSVVPLADGSGYVINFKNSGAVTIKHGEAGADGSTPAIGTKQHTDDKYYWTIDGEWMLDSTGNKLLVTGENGADAITPKMRINSTSNMWEISTDCGNTWTSTGVKAIGENGTDGADGDSFFQSVDDTNPLFVVITLTDGTIMNLPKMPKATVGFDSYEAFNFSFGNSLVQENFIMLNFPATLKKSDFTAMSATLKHSNGEITDIVTRTVASTTTNWGIDLVEPSFKTDGTIDNDHISYVKLSPPTNTASIVDGETFILEVGVINTEGQTSTISRPIVINYNITTGTAGSLSNIIENGDYATYLQTATNIAIKGEINSGDFTALESLITNHSLTHVDLSDVVVVGSIGISYTEEEGWVFQDGNAIPGWAFSESKIKEIILPNSITKIGDRAFQECATLTKINLGSGVEEIGNSVFYNAAKLVSIEIPANVRTLGRWIFEGCSNLATITLNEGLTTLLPSAFYGCTGVESITIPSTVTEIPNWCFDSCTNLTTVTMHDNITSMGEFAFNTCRKLKEVTIPAKVTKIEQCLFQNCIALANVNMHDNITSIGERAFLSAPMESINITDKVEYFGEYAFTMCTKLKSFYIPKGSKTITEGLLSGCNSITEIIIPESVTKIGRLAFSYTEISTITIPANVTELGPTFILGCTGITEIISKAATPPNASNVDTNNNNGFSGLFHNITIKVPAAAVSIYEADWKKLFSYPSRVTFSAMAE